MGCGYYRRHEDKDPDTTVESGRVGKVALYSS